jgi:MFS family permease
MSVTGFCAAIVGVVGPTISDHVGRKPMIIGMLLLGMITPLAGLYFHGPVPVLAALMFIGWISTGAYALFMAVVPGESLPARYAATATGAVVCIGEIVGGFFAPLLGGRAADLTTLAAPLKIAAVCVLGGTILSLFLKETAPVKTSTGSAPREPALTVYD